MLSEAVLTHVFQETCPRYEGAAMKGRNKYKVPEFLKIRYQQIRMSMMKRRHLAALIIFLFGFFFFIVVFLKYIPPLLLDTLKLPPAPPEELFRQYVWSPIPESVINIRADQPKNFGGYRYTFRFNINRDDLGLLINSRRFVRVWNIKYMDGSLDWQWDRDGPFGTGRYNSGIICYNKSTRKPRWFRPGLWDEPEAYALWKEGNQVNIETFGKDSGGPTTIRVLLYNENETEAYFVVQYSEK
jgi:hypothetical protein